MLLIRTETKTVIPMVASIIISCKEVHGDSHSSVTGLPTTLNGFNRGLIEAISLRKFRTLLIFEGIQILFVFMLPRILTRTAYWTRFPTPPRR